MQHKKKYNPSVHHRRSIRLQGYDYSQAGLYFITICTHNRECWFGEIINKEMILNEAGKMADECWLNIPKHFPNTVLHEHVVMPNHIHGIIELKNKDIQVAGDDVASVVVPVDIGVRVQDFEPRREAPKNAYQKIIPRSIGSIVRGYKIGVTKFFRDNTDIHKVWQRDFYENIIRNEQSYYRISQYIINNPRVWDDDKFYDVDITGRGLRKGSKF
jgi:putative transposase